MICLQKQGNINEVRKHNRNRIARYIQDSRTASRQDIAQKLGYSMPTVFSNVTELMNMGLLCEAGEYGSTGGRRAKSLEIRKRYRYSVGMDITKNHVRLILMDIAGDVLDESYHSYTYRDEEAYYQGLGALLTAFLDRTADSREKLIGVGISVPGIVCPEREVLSRSHILEVRNISLKRFSQNIPYPVIFDNDANCAAYVEVEQEESTAYFSLCNTVGGAFYQNGRVCPGENNKSGEFGHMIIHPHGRQCYCGKQGCLDAYCAVWVLQDSVDAKLEDFFEKLDAGDPECQIRWQDYLQNLSIAVSNIRMALDCKIILGGYISSFLPRYMPMFEAYIRTHNNFDADCSYISIGKYARLSSAMGAAQMVIHRYLDNLE